MNRSVKDDAVPLSLPAFIRREMRLAKESRHPNALSLRFVQLHEQAGRNVNEEEEYRTLRALMRTRWRWYKASLDAARSQKSRGG